MRILLTSIFSILFVFAAFGETPAANKGKTIFSARCASCHNLAKVMTGPALAGVHERRDINWIKSFVRSSQTMVKSGDKTAVALFDQFNKIPMPDHKDLSDENIESIVEFIKTAKVETEKPPFEKPSKLRPNYLPLSIAKDGWYFIVFIIVVIGISAALVFAVRVKELQRKTLRQN